MMLLVFGCSKKSEVNAKDAGKKQVVETEYKMYMLQQVPFSKNLADLEKLGNVDFIKSVKNYVEYAPKSLDRISFKLGSDIADALICLKAKDKKSLILITKNLLSYGETLGISKEFLVMSITLKPLIDAEKWGQGYPCLARIKGTNERSVRSRN